MSMTWLQTLFPFCIQTLFFRRYSSSPGETEGSPFRIFRHYATSDFFKPILSPSILSRSKAFCEQLGTMRSKKTFRLSAFFPELSFGQKVTPLAFIADLGFRKSNFASRKFLFRPYETAPKVSSKILNFEKWTFCVSESYAYSLGYSSALRK